MNRLRKDIPNENDAVDVFLKIIEAVSDGRIRLHPHSKIGELVQGPAVLTPLQFELCLYSLEATLRRELDDSFYETEGTEHFQKTVADFIAQYLHDEVSDDPIFVARQFVKFAKSAGWEVEEQAEPGPN